MVEWLDERSFERSIDVEQFNARLASYHGILRYRSAPIFEMEGQTVSCSAYMFGATRFYGRAADVHFYVDLCPTGTDTACACEIIVCFEVHLDDLPGSHFSRLPEVLSLMEPVQTVSIGAMDDSCEYCVVKPERHDKATLTPVYWSPDEDDAMRLCRALERYAKERDLAVLLGSTLRDIDADT